MLGPRNMLSAKGVSSCKYLNRYDNVVSSEHNVQYLNPENIYQLL